MGSQEDKKAGPPKPPPLPRRFRFWPHQWVTIPLLLAVPVLGLAGVFDENRDTKTAFLGNVEMKVRYPTRLRVTHVSHTEIEVKNVSDTPLTELELELDRKYVEAFEEVQFVPDVDRPFVVPVGDLEPGETKRVYVDLKGGDHGVHRGSITLRGAGEIQPVRLRTLMLP